MTAKEILGVAVRAIGIWEAAVGVAQLPTTIWNLHYSLNEDVFVNSARTAVSIAAGESIVGCALFFGAGWIAHKAYPDPLPPAQGDAER